MVMGRVAPVYEGSGELMPAESPELEVELLLSVVFTGLDNQQWTSVTGASHRKRVTWSH